ncbi:hypothetical protein ACO0LM_00740 [Undibacterium sp. Di26W]|uniref:hypothetical protein n=1 Tax=Undibacterium sp. Di26W TaxID=3413035 RepID=UPI003BF10D2F
MWQTLEIATVREGTRKLGLIALPKEREAQIVTGGFSMVPLYSMTPQSMYVSDRNSAASGDNMFVYAVGTEEGVKEGLEDKKPDRLDPDTEIFVYVPLYREVGYLSRLIAPLFQGSFTTNKMVQTPQGAKVDHQVPEGSAAAAIDQTADALIFSGSPREVASLKKVLAQVDTRQGEVMVKGVLYEVSTTDRDGSALSLALNLLGGKFSLSLGDGKALDSFVKFKNNTIDGVYSDTRFKVVSTLSIRVRFGATGSFSVGEDVPILGAVTYPGNGLAPVQSVEYKPSGVVFNVTPKVFEKCHRCQSHPANIKLRCNGNRRQQLTDAHKT